MESDGDDHYRLSFARRNGVSVNKEGGYYCRGRQYGVEKKLAVAACYDYNKQPPVRYRITESTVDAELFTIEIEDAVASRFLRPGDILVMDNAANHTGKENTVLEDWLWKEYSIFALFLPA